MADLNLGHLISKFVNYQALNAQQKATANKPVQTSFTPAPQQSPANNVGNNSIASPQFANMAGVDQSAYVKDMMNLPKNMNELLYILQRNITLAQFNQRFANQINMQRNALSQTQAQILAQLQGLSLTEAQNILLMGNKAVLSQLQSSLRNLPISSTGLINLSEIAAMIQANGKDAIAKLITTMANSAKLGITDLSQLKDTAKIINASIAAAAQNASGQDAQAATTAAGNESAAVGGMTMSTGGGMSAGASGMSGGQVFAMNSLPAGVITTWTSAPNFMRFRMI